MASLRKLCKLGKIYNIYGTTSFKSSQMKHVCIYLVKSLSEKKTHKLAFSQDPKAQSTFSEQVSIEQMAHIQISGKSYQFLLSSLSHLPLTSLLHAC